MPPTPRPAAPPAAAAASKATIPATSKPAPGTAPPAPPAPAKPAAATTAQPAPQPATAPQPAAAKPAADGNGAAPTADKPAAGPATIDFKCPQCDAAIKIDIALSGKMAPCPECSRIVRVPLPRKKQPTDWRNVPTGPSLARTDTEPAPDGAWGSATTVSTVSRQALLEADAATVSREPWTRWQKIKWAAISAATVLVVGASIMGVMNYWSDTQQDKALREAMRNIDGLKNDPLGAAEIHRAIGEYSIRAGGDAVPVGHDHVQAAVAKLAPAEHSSERDALLTDIALLQVDLIPDQAAIDKAQMRIEAERLQERSFKDLERTFSLISAAEGRAEALRQVTRKLHARKMGEQAQRLVGEGGGDRAGAMATVGLELWRVGEVKPATAMAQLLLKNRAEAKEKETKDAKQKDKPPAAALVALCVVLKRPQEEIDKLKPAFGDEFSWRLGQIQGLALLGDWEKARGEKANLKGDPLDPLYADAVLIEAGMDKNPAGNTDLEQAGAWLLTDEGKEAPARWSPESKRPDPSWVLLRLTQLALKAGKPDLAGTFAAAVPNPQLRGRAKLEMLRARLAMTSEVASTDWANDVDESKKLPAYPQACEAIARHNAKHGQGSATMKAIGGWEELLRSFGFVGVALGLQEK